jgi:integrase/recombinase XerD
MKFSESITSYVKHKNTMGVEFANGKRCLDALSRHLGETDLDQIGSEQLLVFLNDSDANAHTWRMKYRILVRFFDFWAIRQQAPYLSFPPPKPSVGQTFIPYVYSKTQIRALVRVRSSQSKTCLDPITLRTFLLFLYATGALVGEARSLLVKNIDLKRRTIEIQSRSLIRCRHIPISNDLCEILSRYFKWRTRHNFDESHFFLNTNGQPVGYHLLDRHFRKQCNALNITRERTSTYQPRMHDLKYSFAVHRITQWIRNGDDLNKMLPALAAYMGMKLVSTERYFQMTPERFKEQLNKLSPSGFKSHWRQDKKLMAFLSGL